MKNKFVTKSTAGLTGFLLTTALSLNAAIIDFNLSPAGTDAAVGLSPLNEVPAVTTSTATGDKILTGIVFDTASRELGFAIGYGMFSGFRDLTGPATAMHIHGPATTGQIAGVQFNLAPFHLPAPFPLSGGFILGAVTLSPAQATDLLAGRYYVNIHTALNPGGEIRGQLIPVLAPPNRMPSVSCPGASVAECGGTATLTALVSDPEGDALTVIWSVNGVAVQTNNLAAGAPGALQSVDFLAVFPLGSNAVTVAVSDASGGVAACETSVFVVDTVAPNLTVSVDKSQLWPPNHKLVSVNVSAVVSDTCSAVSWEIASVSSNQADNIAAAGDASSDWQIVGPDTVLLRAERSSQGGERVYTIAVRAVDAAGNQAITAVPVVVPVRMEK